MFLFWWKKVVVRRLAAHLDVEGLDFVGAREDTSTGNTTEDVGTSTLHQGHETFGLDNLDTAVHGGLVVDT